MLIVAIALARPVLIDPNPPKGSYTSPIGLIDGQLARALCWNPQVHVVTVVDHQAHTDLERRSITTTIRVRAEGTLRGDPPAGLLSFDVHGGALPDRRHVPIPDDWLQPLPGSRYVLAWGPDDAPTGPAHLYGVVPLWSGAPEPDAIRDWLERFCTDTPIR